jgi:DNA-binding transcriptional LysR family regulator
MPYPKGTPRPPNAGRHAGTPNRRTIDRSPRGVEPTIYAEALLKRGDVVFDELRQGIRDIFDTDQLKRTSEITCPSAINYPTD